jgi:protein-disulfide isomerase
MNVKGRRSMFSFAGRPRFSFPRIDGAALVLCLAVAGAAAEPAMTPRPQIEEALRVYIEAHPEAFAPAIDKYLSDHPEAIAKAIQTLIAKRNPAPTADVNAKAAIADNVRALYSAPLQTAFGAAEGAPTLVEFFDFNCGYCRQALTATLTLLSEDSSLRIVLKEYPILGADSAEAAKVAIALQMQRADAAASLEFHRRLLTRRGKIDRAAALAVAGELGFDAEQLGKDAASPEVSEALQQNMRLASALGVRGTPAYVVGDSVVAGAVGAPALKERLVALKKP